MIDRIHYKTPIAGYQIYHPKEKNKKFDFDKNTGGGNPTTSVDYNVGRIELETYGRTPYVYYAGNTNYVNFDLQTVFVSEYDDNNIMTKRAVEKFYEFKELLDRREPLIVASSTGEVFLCDVTISQRTTPSLYVDGDMDFIELTVHCLEIGEA